MKLLRLLLAAACGALVAIVAPYVVEYYQPYRKVRIMTRKD